MQRIPSSIVMENARQTGNQGWRQKEGCREARTNSRESVHLAIYLSSNNVVTVFHTLRKKTTVKQKYENIMLCNMSRLAQHFELLTPLAESTGRTYVEGFIGRHGIQTPVRIKCDQFQ